MAKPSRHAGVAPCRVLSVLLLASSFALASGAQIKLHVDLVPVQKVRARVWDNDDEDPAPVVRSYALSSGEQNEEEEEDAYRPSSSYDEDHVEDNHQEDHEWGNEGLVQTDTLIEAEETEGAEGSPLLAPTEPPGVGRRYLIASFPDLPQVGYVSLPDNVWRPLTVGSLTRPTAVAVDTQAGKLFVSDPSQAVIWQYTLRDSATFSLEIVGPRRLAVGGFAAFWMDVSISGDLYFSGNEVKPKPAGFNSIFRQTATNLAMAEPPAPEEVFTRSNTGGADATAWAPAGVSMDSFSIYWCNRDGGKTHGAVVKGRIDSVGSDQEDPVQATAINTAVSEARGIAATGTHVFWVSPEGIYGASKSSNTDETDPAEGLVSGQPGSGEEPDWNPHTIRWDGDNTMYLTDVASGAIYSLPALNTRPHNMTKFTDAPGILDLAVISFHANGSVRASFWAVTPMLFLVWLSFPLW